MVFFVIPGLLAAALLAALSFEARKTSVALLGVITPLAAFGVVYGYVAVYAGRRCDESCGTRPGRGWPDAHDSWQWGGQLVPVIAALAAILLVAELTRRGRYSLARAPVSVAVALLLLWASFQAPLTSSF